MNRWLGVGLASVTAVVTISLWATGNLDLYINPDSAWFAVSMSVLALVGAVATFALPLGAEDDHGHDHGDAAESAPSAENEPGGPGAPAVVRYPVRPAAVVATVTGGVLASGVTVAALVLPPASLSAELAMARDVGAPPLFAGADTLALATGADTANYGVAEWSATFATATSPDAFDGTDVELTGFVTPDPDDPESFLLTRLVITHCVIDAQPATIPVRDPDWQGDYEVGDWVSIDGEVVADDAGMAVAPATVDIVAEPEDPYEY